MSGWFRRQAYALRAAWGHLRATPGNFLLNMLVLAMTLALPFAGATLLTNVRPITEQLAVETEISLFVKMNTPREQSEALAGSIRKVFQEHGQQVKIIFTPSEKALDQLKERSGLADIVGTLGANPLPDGYLIRLEQYGSAQAAAQIETIVAQLEKLPNVDKVQLDSAWIKRLAALMQVLRLALLFVASTLGVVVVAVVFNTIRLQVMSHLDEIRLLQLVGATDAFIRRPFHYTGALLGFGAGCIALATVALALLPLNVAIADLARLYSSDFQLLPLDVLASALLLFVSALLGWIGATLSVRRHLSRPQ
ncbi:MAG: permease [Burkholderiaceae bacterium]|nr:permease [Burkholderiaceae bacterium]